MNKYFLLILITAFLTQNSYALVLKCVNDTPLVNSKISVLVTDLVTEKAPTITVTEVKPKKTHTTQYTAELDVTDRPGRGLIYRAADKSGVFFSINLTTSPRKDGTWTAALSSATDFIKLACKTARSVAKASSQRTRSESSSSDEKETPNGLGDSRGHGDW